MAASRLAVFLRTYDWGEFAARSAQRVAAQSQGADFFVLADETRSGPRDTAPFRKIAHRAEDFQALGLPLAAPRGETLWWNADYGFYDALLKCPAYDFYFFVEDDVAVNLPLLPIARQMQTAELDLVTFAGHRPVNQSWGMHAFCQQLPYRSKTWTPITVALLSARAASHLLKERQRLGAMRAAGVISEWAFCEAFVSSALGNGGFATELLGRFASVDRFGANLVFLESDPVAREPGSFVHAVLDEARFVPKFFTRARDSLLQTGHYGLLRQARAQLLAIGCTAYEDFRVLPGDGNLALDKPATQSSVSRWSRLAAGRGLDPRAIDARGANCGIVRDKHAFHTEADWNAWWQVDLGAPHELGEVRVYNTTQLPDRARHFSVQISDDGEAWKMVLHKGCDRVFAGADDPFIGQLSRPLRARYVRIVLDREGPLHLSQVEVFGWPGAPPAKKRRRDPTRRFAPPSP